MKITTILAIIAMTINCTTIMAQETIKQTAGRNQLGEFAPKFAELNDDVLLVKCGAEQINSDCVTVAW